MVERYLRPKQASIYLGVCIATIWNYSKAGLIKPIKLSPRATVFKKEDLDRFVEESSNNPS